MNTNKQSHDSLSIEAIDTLEQVDGKFPGARRAHAKGQVYNATFTPNGNAVPYTTAPHLQQKEVAATVRFSNSSTNPTAPDILSPVKGMAVQFHLPEGGESHLIGVSIPIFPTKTPEAFIDMIHILTADKTGIGLVDKGLALKNLVSKYPGSKKALLKLKELKGQPPSSFSELDYYPLHAFFFVNEEGKRQPIRYEWRPILEEKSLSKRDAKNASSDYLSEELDNRLTKGPVTFDLIIQLGQEEDPTDDASEVWPETRTKLSIGQLSITDKQKNPKDDLLFDPTIVSEGIELSEDPILRFRHDAYAVSYERRTM